MSLGGRFGYDDDGQTPNTQIIFLDYDPAPILFEVRGLPASARRRQKKWGSGDMDEYRGVKIGTIIQCADGYVSGGSGSRRGTAAYDNDGNLIKTFAPTNTGIRQNFLDAVRSRRPEDINSPVLQGHLSAALVHLSNISYRLGKRAASDEIRKAISGERTLAEALDRFLAHLDANEIDVDKTPVRMGPMLTMDPATERFVGPFSESANMFLSRNYREPFVVPDTV
jgi:hypothetical protein